MLSQRLQQKLLQKLSPQQILLMKLLQVPTVALEQRIKQEIEENPALEETNDADDLAELTQDFDESTPGDTGETENTEETEEINKDDEFDLDDYLLDDDDVPTYKVSVNNTSPDDERKEVPFVSGTTFHDLLHSQLGLRDFDEKQFNYSGPKPLNKESSIVMIADIVESTTKSLDDFSEKRIKKVLDDTIHNLINEGQLDESPLTLKELEKIKTYMLPILMGVYRKRLEYPEN